MTTRDPADLERLRAAMAAAPVEPGAAADVAPDAGRIFDAVHGELSDTERQALVDQLWRDPDAAEAWRLARELEPPVPASTRLTTSGGSGRGAPWRGMGLAAGLALAVGVAWQLAPWRSTDSPVYRSSERSEIASLLPQGTPLSRTAPTLRWTPIDGAQYRVRVLTADLQPLVEAERLTVAEYTLPAAVVAGLPANAPLLWQVEAVRAGAATVVSPTFSLQLQ